MGELWEDLKKDPLISDLEAVIHVGLDEFKAGELTTLPSIFGSQKNPASAAAIRDRLLGFLMVYDPDRKPTDSDLGEATNIRLALFRATSQTRNKSLEGARDIVGAIRRPSAPISSDAIRKRPSKRQPQGGTEWRVVVAVREQIIQHALESECDLPPNLVGATSTTQTPNQPSSVEIGSHVVNPNDASENPVEYQKVTPAQLEKDFFERASTEKYIEALQSLDGVTLYAGAGVSADLGAPLGDTLMNYLLEVYAGQHKDLASLHAQGDYQDDEGRQEEATTQLREAAVRRIVGAISTAYPPGYIGSIVRELAESQHIRRTRTHEQTLIENIRAGTDQGVSTGGFLARSVGVLAFALKRKGGKAIEIVTTNYDDSIRQEQESIEKYFEKFFANCNYQLHVRYSGAFDDLDELDIPLIYINGVGPDETLRALDPPVVGEAEFFSAGGDPDSGYQKWREAVLDNVLGQGVCLFVGSSLTDPDVLAALATTSSQGRYAIVLAPDRDRLPDGTNRLTRPDGKPFDEAVERALVRDLVCQRYLHLDVIPIMVDRPYQVPQLLTEIALKTVDPSYKSYTQRLGEWWDEMAEKFGYHDKENAGERDRREQETWQKSLEELRGELDGELDDASAENIMVEVWVRNPRSGELFLWATSESLWLHGDTAHVCGIDETNSRFAVQRVFWQGNRRAGNIEPQRGRWQHHFSVPLTLHNEPWYHLPVGVASVLSSNNHGKLAQAKNDIRLIEKLESMLQGRANDLLDPQGPRSI